MEKAKCGVKEIGGVLALLVFVSVAVAQNPQPAAPRAAAAQAPVAAPQATAPTAPASPTATPSPVTSLTVSYVGGKLRIDALDSTLKAVLTRVAALTGMKIEIPDGASAERLPLVQLGPGPAREILGSLLYGSDFDYLIQASVTDPDGIQSVLLVPHEKKGGAGSGVDATAHPTHSPNVRAAAQPPKPEEDAEPASPPPSQPEPVEAAAAPSTPPPTSPTPLSVQPEGSMLSSNQSLLSGAAALTNRSGLTTEGAMQPPSSMDSGTINQQLLQMYQQRAQMTQAIQGRPMPSPQPAANSPSQ